MKKESRSVPPGMVCMVCRKKDDEPVLIPSSELDIGTKDYLDVYGEWDGERLVGGLQGECFGTWNGEEMMWAACRRCGCISWRKDSKS